MVNGLTAIARRTEHGARVIHNVNSARVWPMVHDLHALLSLIDADHERIDALAAQTLQLIAAVSADNPQRDEICYVLHDALQLFLKHFLREHEAMHQVDAPRDYIEAHAAEHDALMAQLRILTERFQAGAASGEILVDLAAIHTAVERHRATADADLYRYLHAVIDLDARPTGS